MSVDYQLDDVEALYQQETSKDLVREANAAPTVRTGSYRLVPVAVTVKKADDKSPIPGRLMARVQADAFQEGQRKGRVFYSVSPEAHRKTRADGSTKLDGPASLWGQGLKAFGVETVSIKEQFDAFGAYPVDGYVTEAFRTLAGELITPRTPDEREELVQKGAEPTNFVMNLRKVK